MMHGLKGKDVLSVKQFSPDDLEAIFRNTDLLRSNVEHGIALNPLAGMVLACVFYEPSTRTFSSFVSAMQRLGGSVIPIQNVAYSSVAKGETFEDTIRTLGLYADAVVLRHNIKGSARKGAACLDKPLINAGDGIGEHPTQAFLDAYTIRRRFSDWPWGLTITMLGDLKHGRTIHSLARLVALYVKKARHFKKLPVLRFVSPPELRIPRGLHAELRDASVPFTEHTDLGKVLKGTDVLYVTRVQKERFKTPEAYQRVQGSYIITPDTLKAMKKTAIVMHPLPRVGEISMEVDADPRAAYFEQVENGLYVRMALLAMVLGKM
jgi:aspartate carbamoyltransferase catalytic subunit